MSNFQSNFDKELNQATNMGELLDVVQKTLRSNKTLWNCHKNYGSYWCKKDN